MVYIYLSINYGNCRPLPISINFHTQEEVVKLNSDKRLTFSYEQFAIYMAAEAVPLYLTDQRELCPKNFRNATDRGEKY